MTTSLIVIMAISLIVNLVFAYKFAESGRNAKLEKEARELQAKFDAELAHRKYVDGLISQITELKDTVERLTCNDNNKRNTIARLEDNATKGAKLVEGVKCVGEALSPSGIGKGIGSLVKGVKALGPAIKNGFKEGYDSVPQPK